MVEWERRSNQLEENLRLIEVAQKEIGES